jgi:hypothetical protein
MGFGIYINLFVSIVHLINLQSLPHTQLYDVCSQPCEGRSPNLKLRLIWLVFLILSLSLSK